MNQVRSKAPLVTAINKMRVENTAGRLLAKKMDNHQVLSSPATPRNRNQCLRTPQSGASSTYSTDSNNNCIILALCEGRGEARQEVGLAAIDIYRPCLKIYQVSDTQGYQETISAINLLNADEIVVPSTLADSRLIQIIKQTFNMTIHGLRRRFFDANLGLQIIQHLCLPLDANHIFDTQHKYFALAAVSGLINYLEMIRHVTFVTKSVKMTYLRTDRTVAVDFDTAYRLELIQSTQETNKNAGLFGILNKCLTNGGRRLLRANILQPLCKQDEIEERLESIEELVRSPEIINSLQLALPNFSTVDHILTLCIKTPDAFNYHIAEMQLKYILHLKSFIENIPALLESFASTTSKVFLRIKENLSSLNYANILDLILQVIKKDAFPTKGHLGEIQRCFSVKSGSNHILDLNRKHYSELVDAANAEVQNLAEKYQLNLAMNYNANKAMHIVMKLKPHQKRLKSSDLPAEFINITRHPSSFSMTTILLAQLSRRLKDTRLSIEGLSHSIIYSTLNTIRKDIASFYVLCESIAELDIIQCLTETAKIPNYVKPEFSTEYTHITGSRHPILEHVTADVPTPNNILATTNLNFHIITGPNMGGKTLYIKQVAILYILAQIGSYVPAHTACFRITDRIFARINFDDSLEWGASTFQLDIREMNCIINNLTPTSLVIIDEFCRGTVHNEGTATAWAFCEKFLCTTAFVFMATHYLTLTKLADMYPRVSNWHMEAIERQAGDEVRLTCTHRLLPGPTSLERYGLAAARASALPRTVVQRTAELMDLLRPTVKPTININKPNIETLRHLRYRFVAEVKLLHLLRQLNRDLLKQMKEKYQNSVEEISHKCNSDLAEQILNEYSLENMLNSTSEVAKHSEEQFDNVGDELILKKDYQFLHPCAIFAETSSDTDTQNDRNALVANFNSTTSSNSSQNNCLDLLAVVYSDSTSSIQTIETRRLKPAFSNETSMVNDKKSKSNKNLEDLEENRAFQKHFLVNSDIIIHNLQTPKAMNEDNSVEESIQLRKNKCNTDDIQTINVATNLESHRSNSIQIWSSVSTPSRVNTDTLPNNKMRTPCNDAIVNLGTPSTSTVQVNDSTNLELRKTNITEMWSTPSTATRDDTVVSEMRITLSNEVITPKYATPTAEYFPVTAQETSTNQPWSNPSTFSRELRGREMTSTFNKKRIRQQNIGTAITPVIRSSSLQQITSAPDFINIQQNYSEIVQHDPSIKRCKGTKSSDDSNKSFQKTICTNNTLEIIKSVCHESLSSTSKENKAATSISKTSTSVSIIEGTICNETPNNELNLPQIQSVNSSTSSVPSNSWMQIFSNRRKEDFQKLINSIKPYEPEIENVSLKCVFRSDAFMSDRT